MEQWDQLLQVWGIGNSMRTYLPLSIWGRLNKYILVINLTYFSVLHQNIIVSNPRYILQNSSKINWSILKIESPVEKTGFCN